MPALKDKNGKIDVTSFLPKAQALITMAPAEKQDLFSRLKYVQRKVHQQKDSDPIEINKKVASGDLNPCEAHAKIAAIEQAQASSKKVAPQITETQALQDRERKTKSVQRAAIKAAFSGMNQLENQQFEELFKQTMKQISQANGQFQTHKLMDKIKEKGSLYGMQNEEEQVHEESEKPS